MFLQYFKKKPVRKDKRCETSTALVSKYPPSSPHEVNTLYDFPPSMVKMKEEENSQKQKEKDNSEERRNCMFEGIQKNQDENCYNVLEIIRGLKEYQNRITEESLYVVSDKNLLVNTPLAPGITVLAYLVKQQHSLKRMLNPQYNLYLKASNQHLLSAKNFPINSEIFKISLEKGGSYSRKDNKYLASLTCDEQIRMFLLHQPINEKILKTINSEKQEPSKPFQDLKLVISYENQKKKSKQLLMQVYGNFSEDLHVLFDRKSEDNFKKSVKKLKNKFLTLRENVTDEKRKNRDFELVDKQGDEYKYLGFREINEKQKIYELKISHPFSILQAFATALTRFQLCLV